MFVIKKDEESGYKQALLKQLYRLTPGSRTEEEAAIYLKIFLNDNDFRKRVQEYVQTKASPKVRLKIEDLLNEPRWTSSHF